MGLHQEILWHEGDHGTQRLSFGNVEGHQKYVEPLSLCSSTNIWLGEEKTPEDLQRILQERGKKFENLCTAKLEKRHRAYAGLAIPAGSVEMAVDDPSSDVS